jgi:hypothetical protein
LPAWHETWVSKYPKQDHDYKKPQHCMLFIPKILNPYEELAKFNIKMAYVIGPMLDRRVFINSLTDAVPFCCGFLQEKKLKYKA